MVVVVLLIAMGQNLIVMGLGLLPIVMDLGIVMGMGLGIPAVCVLIFGVIRTHIIPTRAMCHIIQMNIIW